MNIKRDSGAWAISALVFLLVLSACNSGDGSEDKVPTTGSMAGEATIICDAAVYDVMMPALQMHDSAYPLAHITVERLDARKGMQQLMAGNTPGLIIARDYLPDEDSLLKSFDVEPYTEYIFAQDALVFVVRDDYPIDTLSHTLLQRKLLSSDPILRESFPQLEAEPHFVCSNINSSAYANILLKITDMQAPLARFQFAGTADSVFTVVRSADNVIGVALLSQAVKQSDLRMIPVGFMREDGVQIPPRLVHQSRIVMDMYPYPINIRGWLLKGMTQDVVWGTFVYLARDPEVMLYFRDAGIVPEHAHFNLKVSE